MNVPLVLFASFILLLLIGVPVSISIAASTLCALFASGGNTSMVAQVAFSGNDSFALLAVPMFIVAGVVMERGGLSDRIVKIAAALVGPMYGGLACVTIFACIFFGAMCGSAPATVAAIGGLMIPSMIRQGYDRKFSAAVAACSGGLGVLIPPSIPLIIYGITVGASITDLFLATIVPGVLTGVAMILVSVFICRKHNWRGSREEFGFRPFLRALWKGKWAILAPVIILGGIYGGICTPTEAGVVAVIYSVLVGVLIHKEIKLSMIPQLLLESAVNSSVVMIIVGFSTAFGQIMSLYRIPDMIAGAILSISSNRFVILLLIDALMLFLGTFMDTGPIIIIFAPLLVPLCNSVGIDKVYLGVLICLATEIGMMTPPLGCNLFVGQKIAKIGLGEIFRACFPLIGAQLAVLVLITLFPGIVTMVI